jgi:molecular chaperone GrpE
MSGELEKLQKELEETTKQAEEYLDGWKRAKADFANREKDLTREKSEYLQFATAAMLLEILVIYESLCEAVQSVDDKGIAQIKKQFEDFLKKKGLEKIKTVGEKFDYNLHEAAGTEKIPHAPLDKGGEDVKSGEIIKEIQAGYKLHGEVLRPAKVIVTE